MDTLEQLCDETGILNCQCCSLKLKDPKELKCRCVLCHRCINKHFQSPTQENAKCPACNTPSENPPEIKDVSRPLEKLLMINSGTRCACESPGCNKNVRVSYICVKCQLHLCENCKTLVCSGVIRDIPTTPEHEACPFKNITPELSRIIIINKQKMCGIHEKDFVYFCEKCHECICELCKLDLHPHHLHADLKKKSDSYLTMLLKQSKALTKKMDENEAALRIYREIINSATTPDIISLENCKNKESLLQQKVEKYDCLIKCITQLKILGSPVAILKIGKDIEEDILEQLKLSPLNDLRIASEWWHDIENKLNVSGSTEEDSDSMDCLTTTDDDKSTEVEENRVTTRGSQAIPDDCQEDKSSNKDDAEKTPKVLPKDLIDKQRTIHTRAYTSKRDKNNQGMATVNHNKNTCDNGQHEEAPTNSLKDKSTRATTIPVGNVPITRPNILKRTMQTRSYTSGTKNDDNQREDGGKAKRSRMIPCVDRSPAGSEGDFKCLSASTTRQASFALKSTVDEAKIAIAEVIGTDKRHLDIVESGRVVEGSELVMDVKRPLQVVLHNINRQVPVIYKTSAPDMVDSEEESPRVEMSCGHAITPENLYRYCYNQATKKSSFLCFADNGADGRCCDREWLFEEVAKKACLSNDERILWESFINRKSVNYSSEAPVCPNCRRTCNPQKIKNACVKCIHCQKAGKTQFRFCCYCLEKWTNNHTCKTITVQQTLNNCDRKKIVNVSDCPSIRACPECHTLIQHAEGCKHMRCVQCSCTFCFVCLSVRGDKGFECGSFQAVCKTAPIQSVA